MPSKVAALKPLLTMKTKWKRPALFRKYKRWTAADWEKVKY
jgi:hypothetical protein